MFGFTVVNITTGKIGKMGESSKKNSVRLIGGKREHRQTAKKIPKIEAQRRGEAALNGLPSDAAIQLAAATSNPAS